MQTEPFQARRVVLGTMRMLEKNPSSLHWVELFSAAWSAGVRRLHSSDEYESFAFLGDVLDRLAKRRPEIKFEHIIKLAEPSFEDAFFDSKRFISRVEKYLRHLHADRIETVQYMWRQNLSDDEERVDAFRAAALGIGEAADLVKRGGLISELGCFPYTVPFAKAAIESRQFDGLIVYRSLLETQFDGVIGLARDAGMFVDAIRPFAQGEAFRRTGRSARELLADLAKDTGVRHAVISVSTVEQLAEALPHGASFEATA